MRSDGGPDWDALGEMRWNLVDPADGLAPKDRPCPQCGATVGIRCFDTGYSDFKYVRVEPHIARFKAPPHPVKPPEDAIKLVDGNGVETWI